MLNYDASTAPDKKFGEAMFQFAFVALPRLNMIHYLVGLWNPSRNIGI